MNRKARRTAEARPQAMASRLKADHRALLAQAAISLSRGDYNTSAIAAKAVLAGNPRSAEAHYLLGNSYLLMAQADKAAACYRQAIALLPSLAEAHNNLGNALTALDCTDEAIAAFRAATATRETYTEAHYNLGNLFEKLGRNQEAVAAYRHALALRPAFIECLNNLSTLFVKLGQPAEAAIVSRQAITAGPRVRESHSNLGNALRACGQQSEAIAAYRQTLTLRPNDAEAYIAIGNILQGQDRNDEADAHFRHAQRLRPSGKWPAAKRRPDFSVLLLTAPGTANTPIEYLVNRARYDTYFVGLMADTTPDAALLRAHCDVVVNLICDADQCKAVRPLAADLAVRLERPVINHPEKILSTGREMIAARLNGIAFCRVPKTVRLAGTALTASTPPAALAEFTLPFLMRRSGAHGGDDFEKIADEDAIAPLASRHPDAAYYITEYVDYRSPDGFYRKYRLIFVDGQFFPYHLAIADHWKVHHFRTDMANQAWMRAEEEAFLRNPHAVFNAGHMEALRTIQTIVGLDYFGIDCALDQNGNMLVFEVNATMLVHGESAVFAYKEPYVAQIKKAFDIMLGKAASFISRS